MARSIAVVSEDNLKIESYLKSLPQGSVVPYKDIQQYTGVEMNYRGKQLMRSAFKRMRMIWETYRSFGIRTGCPQNSMPIMSHSLCKINNAVKKGDKISGIIQEQFLADMNDVDKQRVLFCAAVFGAIRVAAEQGKMLYGDRNKQKAINSSKPIMPD